MLDWILAWSSVLVSFHCFSCSTLVKGLEDVHLWPVGFPMCFTVPPRISRGMSLLSTRASETSRSILSLIQVLEGNVMFQWFYLGLVREMWGFWELWMEVVQRALWWILRATAKSNVQGKETTSAALDPFYIKFCSILPRGQWICLWQMLHLH